MIRKFSVAVVGLALVLTGCSSSDSSGNVANDCKPAITVDTIKEGELQVAGFVSPPSVTTVEGSRDDLGGIDTEVIKKLAKDACLKLVLKTTSPAAGVGDLESKRIDVLIGGIGYTPERAEAFGASTEMYEQPMALISESGASTVDDLMAVDGVGVVQGYRWQEDLEKVLGDKLKVYQSGEAMLNDLKSDRIQIATFDRGEAIVNAEKLNMGLKVETMAPDDRVAASLEPAKVIVLYTKGNASLGEALDAKINAMKQDGTMDKLLEPTGLGNSNS